MISETVQDDVQDDGDFRDDAFLKWEVRNSLETPTKTHNKNAQQF